MTVHPDDLFELLRKMRMDCSQLQARITEVAEMLAALDLKAPPDHQCPRCGVDCDNRLALLDHLVIVHDECHAERETAWNALEKKTVRGGYVK